ncbi:MAG: transcriptional regulator [Phyllobacteriaceae bacterium]|nr:transcriptional regulator [Phyllobacteriaceae bacterium]MBA89626.1 transcriptional regulator [Phyllobacteriaceae bacterium]
MKNTETQERIDALLARYVSGLLPEPARVLVDAHLEISPVNRSMVNGLETLAGDVLEHMEPAPIHGADACLERIFASRAPEIRLPRAVSSDGLLPRAIAGFIGMTADEIPWKTKMPGFRDFELGEIDGCHVELFWIKPGRAIPKHTHEGMELSLVLDGAFNDDTGRYARGDISVNDETVDHRPIAEKTTPCIGMAVTDGPLRLTGSIGQRLSDILLA